MSSEIKNIFTIDTEDWFHANYEDGLFDNSGLQRSTVEQNVDVYLELFDQYHVKATFFVLGFVAQEHPELLRRIAEQGHEIASHGYGHQLVYKQSPREFREDIRRGKGLIEEIIGQPVCGYRAPSWSITRKSLWALSILEEEGFRYDSSIFPFENFLYGIKDAPRFPYRPEQYQPGSTLLEIPPSTIECLGQTLPFSGGFYFRAMPAAVIARFTRMVNRQEQPAVFYLHPREIDPEQPRLVLQPRDALIHYYGIRSCRKKLVKILQQFAFTSIRDALLSEK